MSPIKTILAAVDFSPVTGPVLAVVAGLARSLEARVLLLHVVPVPLAMPAYQINPDEAAQLMIAAEKDASRRLADLAGDLTGIVAEPLTATGTPADEIVRDALWSTADFIVVGSHGHRALYELLIGSTTRGVLKKAVCPVLIVPAANGATKPKAVAEAATESVTAGR